METTSDTEAVLGLSDFRFPSPGGHWQSAGEAGSVPCLQRTCNQGASQESSYSLYGNNRTISQGQRVRGDVGNGRFRRALEAATEVV